MVCGWHWLPKFVYILTRTNTPKAWSDDFNALIIDSSAAAVEQVCSSPGNYLVVLEKLDLVKQLRHWVPIMPFLELWLLLRSRSNVPSRDFEPYCSAGRFKMSHDWLSWKFSHPVDLYGTTHAFNFPERQETDMGLTPSYSETK